MRTEDTYGCVFEISDTRNPYNRRSPVALNGDVNRCDYPREDGN